MVSVREAAAIVGRTPETIRRWVWSGRLASRKQNNRLLIARDDLDQAADRSEPALSLREWAKLATKRRPAGTGSAADLVLADRAARSQADAGR